PGVALEQLRQQVQRRRLDERLVALEVDDDVGVEAAGGLGHAVGAGGVVAPGQDDAAAEALDGGDDARVVGGDDDGLGAARPAGALVDVLDEVLAGLAQQRLAGQPARAVAGGDDDRRLHGGTSLSGEPRRSGWGKRGLDSFGAGGASPAGPFRPGCRAGPCPGGYARPPVAVACWGCCPVSSRLRCWRFLMRIPVMHGVIDRRILVNYHADPGVLAPLLPAPFPPKRVRGAGL